MPEGSALLASDREALERMWREGAWTGEEAWGALPHLDALYRAGLLLTLPTEIGPVVTLSAKGKRAVFGTSDVGPSLTRAMDDAYLRLCLRDHRCTLIEDPPAWVNWTGLPLALTPFGKALVVGRLSRGGYTALGVRRLLERLNSDLLSRGVVLVVFTPSARRAQDLAVREAHKLRVVPHRPQVPQDDERRSGLSPRAPDEPGEEGPEDRLDGPVLTEMGAAALRAQGVPDLTLEVLSRTRAERIERAREALLCDGVLAETQLRRHFGLGPRDLVGAWMVEDIVRPVHGRFALEVPARFYVAARSMRLMDASTLSHRAGTAELRLRLGVAPEAWEVEARGRLRYEEPDAVWHPEGGAGSGSGGGVGGAVAVEYDSGAYTSGVVRRKVRMFRDRGFSGVLWGVPGALRARRLAPLVGGRVEVVRWWERAAPGTPVEPGRGSEGARSEGAKGGERGEEGRNVRRNRGGEVTK